MSNSLKMLPRQITAFFGAITLVICIFPTVENANIVFFLGVSSYSHRVPMTPLANALGDNGHNVTFVSPHHAKEPNPKIYDYVPKKLKEWVDNWDDLENIFEERKTGDWAKIWITLPDFGVMMCEEIYKDEEYVEWVKSSKVDLVFIDGASNDCAFGMAYYWGAKVISFQPSAPIAFNAGPYGYPDETAWIPSMEFYYPADMSFRQRMANALLPVAWEYFRRWTYFPKLEEITKQKLGMEEVPSFEEMERKTSMIFLNTHYGEEYARALPPNTISIGGIANAGKRKGLPKELDTFLSKGNGFIYMSFGTYADFFQFDKSAQQAFIQTMKKLSDIQFVWKIGNDSFAKEFPAGNVYMSKWMPQQDILAHPKIRGFITHSGIMGVQEAIHNSVPLISFPIFADQDYNAERIHWKEYGLRLELTTVTQAQVEDAINKVLHDPKYNNNMKRVSMLFNERPQEPLDTALWWTEFVLRHSQEELKALRPLSVGQPWWVRRQLDVWVTLMGAAVTLILLMIFIGWKLQKWTSCKNASGSPSSIRTANESQRQKKKVQ